MISKLETNEQKDSINGSSGSTNKDRDRRDKNSTKYIRIEEEDVRQNNQRVG